MRFSGYRVPHPLEPAIQVKVQTRSENPGPVQAVEASINTLLKELNTFEDRFRAELNRQAPRTAPPMPSGVGDGFEPMMS